VADRFDLRRDIALSTRVVSNGPLDPDVAREVIADYAQRRRRIRESLTSLPWPANEKGALEDLGRRPADYLGIGLAGKPRVFMPYLGGVGPDRRRCDEIATAGYEGFAPP
jgi:hypothetical protein